MGRVGNKTGRVGFGDEFSCSPFNVSLDEIPVLKNMEKDYVLLVKSWYDDQKLFSSQIFANRGHLSEIKGDNIDDHIVTLVITKLDECGRSCRTDVKSKAIAWLLTEICKAMEKEDCCPQWEPILVGSAAECTQACT